MATNEMATSSLIDPKLAITVARKALADWEVSNHASLAAYLPSKEVKDIAYEIDYIDDAAVTAANWRAFDGAATGETYGSGAKAVGSLQPVSRIDTVTEEAKLRMRFDANEALKRTYIDRIARAAQSIALQVNYQRANALFKAKLSLQGSGGLRIEVDFNRDPAFNPTATKLFSDPSANPFEQLLIWRDQYFDKNHIEPAEIWMPSVVFRAFLRHPNVVSATNPAYAREPKFATRTAVNEVMVDTLGLPPIVEKSAQKVKVDDFDTGKTKLVNVIPQDQVFFMPKPGSAAAPNDFEDYGVTLWGESANVDLPGINKVFDDKFGTPGIIAGVLTHNNFPVYSEVFADALAMPVVIQPNKVLAGKVL